MTKNYGFRQKYTFLEQGMSNFWKMFRGKRRKWYLGSPKHINLIFRILNIVFMNIVIRRPLPEHERARLQLQSPMPSNPASPKPSNPDTPQASEHPSIQASLTAGIPYSTILKGTHFWAAGCHRGFLDAEPEAPPHPPWPSNWCSRLHGSAKKLIWQASEHPGIQASGHPRINPSGLRGRRQTR